MPPMRRARQQVSAAGAGALAVDTTVRNTHAPLRVGSAQLPKRYPVSPRERRLLDQIDSHSQELVRLAKVDLPRLRGQAAKLRDEGLDAIAQEIDQHADRLHALAEALDVDSMQLLALTDPHLDDTRPLSITRAE